MLAFLAEASGQMKSKFAPLQEHTASQTPLPREQDEPQARPPEVFEGGWGGQLSKMPPPGFSALAVCSKSAYREWGIESGDD